MSYDASDPKQVRDRIKQLKVEESLKLALIQQIMSTREGRAWIYSILEVTHIWLSSFSSDALIMAFNEGERFIGLMLLADVTTAAPERYLEMLQEARELTQLEKLMEKPTGDLDDGFDPTAAG